MKCGNKECGDYSARHCNNCGVYRGAHPEEACKHHTPLTAKKDPSADVTCKDVLCKTPSIDKEELTPSQYIKSTDIDDEYDKLYVKHQIVIAALKEIGNWPFDIDGFDTAKEAACGMSGRANWVLGDIA